MKLNIEELAKQAYVIDSLEKFPQWKETEFTDMFLEELNRFLEIYTKFIVERCAQEAEALADKLLCVHDNEGALIALEARGNIRQLLED